MDKNKIIIIALIAIIAVLLVGMFAMMPNTTKKDTKLSFSNDTLNEGDSLKIMLTDVNGTAIAYQTVNVTINDGDESSDYHSVVTNSEGIGFLNLDNSAGEYKVTISYGGNENYTGSNTTQNLTIKEEVKETSSSTTTSSESSGNSYVDQILNDPSCTVVKDPYSICPIHGVPYWQDNVCDWFINP